MPSFSTEGIKAATEIDKQIIALSTGAVAFTVTFIDKFEVKTDGALHLPIPLYVAWILFGLTIGFAIFDLMGLTGTLDAIDRVQNRWPMTSAQRKAIQGSTKHTDWSALGMYGCFAFAVIAMIVTGATLRLNRGGADAGKAKVQTAVVAVPKVDNSGHRPLGDTNGCRSTAPCR